MWRPSFRRCCVVLSVLGAIALVACGGEAEPKTCPTTWTSSAYVDGACAPPPGLLSDAEQRMGSGVIGFVSLVGGSCSVCERCSCTTGMVRQHDVRVYSSSTAARFAGQSLEPCTVDASVPVLARAKTNEEGLYELALAPNDYSIAAFDPGSGCDRVTAVRVRGVQLVPFRFDHGVY